MAWLIVVNGGSLSIDSSEPDSVISTLQENEIYLGLFDSVSAAGLYFNVSSSSQDGGDPCAVFIIGKEILPGRYICQGEIASRSLKMSDDDQKNIQRFLGQLEEILTDAGYSVDRVNGIVLNHFD